MRNRALLWACLALAACASEKPRFDDIRSVAPGFSVPAKTKGLSIRIFNTGDVRAFGGAISRKKSWFSKVHMDFPAFLINHPARGLILFDTGFHPLLE